MDKMLAVKFLGAVFLTRAFATKLSTDGSIVYFSGNAADKGWQGTSIVGAVNGALHGLAKNLAYELSPIRVNAVSPGVVATPTWDFMSNESKPEFYHRIDDSLPAKRIGQAEDLADAAHYLMKNRYTNGTVLTVDGGAYA